MADFPRSRRRQHEECECVRAVLVSWRDSERRECVLETFRVGQGGMVPACSSASWERRAQSQARVGVLPPPRHDAVVEDGVEALPDS